METVFHLTVGQPVAKKNLFPTDACRRAESGQGVIVFAILVLVFLVIGGASIALLKNASASKTVVDQRSLQSYYVAMAGVQESLSTRMYPSSNALAWWRPNPKNMPIGIGPTAAAEPANRVTPLYGLPNTLNPSFAYPDEGIVCQASTRPCPTASVIGMYRYFILNGDQGVNAQTSNGTAVDYWANTYDNAQGDPAKIAPQAFPVNQTDPNKSAAEFIVVSKGYTCVPIDGNGKQAGIAVPGALNDTRNKTTDNLIPTAGNTGYLIPSCRSPFNGVTMQMDTTTLISRVVIDPDTGGSDHVINTAVFKDDTNLTVAGGRKVFIPGTGWTASAFSFEPVFSYFGGAAANPATPGHIVFYDFVKNNIICSATITATTTDLRTDPACNTIGPKTVMQLYFLGPIDHRSIDPYNEFSFKYCSDDDATQPANARCNIQVNRAGVPEPGYQMIFEPPKSNQIKLMPNLQSLPSGATDYEVVINTQNIRSWTGAPGPTGPYRIQFRVN